jgi:emp24/gp25L/p24 family/GOLD
MRSLPYHPHNGSSRSIRRQNSVSSLWPFLVIVGFFCLTMLKQSHALFPVVLEVDEDESRCFNFNVGSNADVHLIMLPLPHETQIDNHDLVESWYVQQVYKMLRQKLDSDDRNGATSDSSSSTDGAPIPLQIVSHKRIPASIEKAIAPFQRGVSSSSSSSRKSQPPIKVTVSVVGADADNPKLQYNTSYKAKYFEPLVINSLRRTFADKNNNPRQHQQQNANFMSVRLCIINQDEEEHVHVVFVKLQDGEDIGEHDGAPITGDEVQENEDETPEQAKARKFFEKEKHLNPLDTSLQRSINAANAVLRDMKFMELREKRLRQTSDNINNRIRWFAYISVSILLAVTYMQVTYLKSYFHKKKVL